MPFLLDDDPRGPNRNSTTSTGPYGAPGATMASAGPREDEKIDDWVNQMDTILGGLGQVQVLSRVLFQSQHVFFNDEFVCMQGVLEVV